MKLLKSSRNGTSFLEFKESTILRVKLLKPMRRLISLQKRFTIKLPEENINGVLS